MVKLIKLLVHVLLSTTAAVWFMKCVKLGDGVELLNASFIASLCLNWFIDYLGHKGRYRAPTTHEPINASAVSALVAVVVGALFLYDVKSYVAVFVACGITYITHLALDLASGGIYVRNGSSFERVRFAKPSRRTYDALNSVVLALSVVMTAMYLLSSWFQL
ncbi:MAG: hypothetical protein QW503_04235 [Sulfolobales archaeon]